MAERPEDLNLPITVVQRLVKDALPDGVIVSKEARQTISRASSVFVLYLTACAVAHANKAKRKTLAVNDILAACSDMEFESFVPDLNSALKFRKEFLAQSAKAKPTKAAKKDAEGGAGEEEADAEMEAEETVANEAEEVVEDEEEEEENEAQENGLEQTKKKRKLSDSVPTEDKPVEEDDAVEVDDSSEEEEEEEEEKIL